MDELEIVTGQDHPDFLDLPWDTPLRDWTHPRLVEIVKGPSRHVVRMVDYDDRVYAIKETNPPLAVAEFEVLRDLRELNLPTVEPVGYVTGRTTPEGESLDAAIVTRFLDYSLPYGYLLAVERPGFVREHLLSAAVVLFARLHLEGVYWGDASLGNVLFRRDAGGLMAYLVDAETTEVRPSLSEGMRRNDIDIARENLVGALLDLVAAGVLDEDFDPFELVDELEDRYYGLWHELTAAEVMPSTERWRIRERIDRLHQLGFDVEELRVRSKEGGSVLEMQPRVIDEGHAHRRLRSLTGLGVQEGQARDLLHAIFAHGAWLEQHEGVELPETVKGQRWMSERYFPLLASIPPEYTDRFDDAEHFHRFSAHRDAMSREQQREIPHDEAIQMYIHDVLPFLPDEKRVGAEVAALVDQEDGEGVAGMQELWQASTLEWNELNQRPVVANNGAGG